MATYGGPNIIRDGLVLYLEATNQKSYSGTGTTWNDLIGNGNNGTLVNGVGFSGSSMVFDGVNDEIQLSTELQLDESWTLNYYQNVNITQNMLSLPSLFTIIPQKGTGSPGYFSLGFVNFTSIRAIHIDNLNNIYVGGQFGGYNNTFRSSLIKINEDGSINNDFNIGSLNDGVWTVDKIQQLSNGTIVSSTTNLGTGLGIMFNNPNTGQAITFAADPNPRICISFIIKESTNSIYVLDSWVSTYQNKSLAGKIFKLDLTSGNIDINFDSSTGFKSAVGKITVSSTEGVNDGIVLQDGHLLCVGTFLEYKGIPTNRIVKINSNTAALDTSFNFGTGFNSTTTSAIQMNNGTIIIVGSFTTYNGVTKNRIVGLNNDGTINNEFKVGTGFNNTVNSIIYDSVNDKLFCFGLFTSYSGITANRIVKLNSDGTIDNSFNYGTGFNSTTFNGKLDNQGRLVVLGDPTLTYKNQSLPRRICRINPDGSLDSNFVSNGFNLDRYRQDTLPRLIDNTVPFLTGFFGINGKREVINQPNGAMDFNGTKYYTISFNHTTNQILTYINGVLRRTHNLNARLPFRCKIFRSYGNFSNLTVYNRALTPQEVFQNYNATKSRFNL